MRYAAFYRNLNLGRTNCPNRAQFEAAFIDAGAIEAASFLTNGTMAFDARSLAAARKIVKAASLSLEKSCGLKEPCFLREMDKLASLAATDPFESIDRATVYDCCITFLHPAISYTGDLPASNARGDVEIVRITASEVLTVSRKLTQSPGSPNAFLEKAFDLPATTRVWNTVVRLVQKHGSAG